ncbi:ABC transporter substrate-binding protein [Rhodopila sp.]|uniref:ABC transporter substrate-binding protein n=1 Tax=Rhodopila sp. TaxID=2480087 RepID=UPI003D0DE475
MNRSMPRRGVLAAGLAAVALPRTASAQGRPIRIGVLTDMVGAYAANTGPGSVAGARLAIEDFARLHPDLKVELVSADLQLKPDVAVGIAGDWLDNQGVDLITDVPLSSAAFAISDMVKAKDKAAIFNGAASADITGKHCGPNHLHWAYDTWSMPHGVVDATVKEGGNSWFFITADYAFGHSLETDAANFVTAAGGKVLGQALAPFPGTTDFSSHLVQAQASGAKVIGFANGGSDTVNCIKQSAEFGIQKGGQKIAGLLFLLHDVRGVGLAAAQGVLLTEPFYWDTNDGTRAFAKRFAELMPGNMPGSVHAGQYSAVTHYLKACLAVGQAKAKASGRAVIDQMKATPTEDPLFGKGWVRKDGRAIHDMYLFEVKSPQQSKQPWDYYTLKRTVPGAEAFRPIDQGGCKLAIG